MLTLPARRFEARTRRLFVRGGRGDLDGLELIQRCPVAPAGDDHYRRGRAVG